MKGTQRSVSSFLLISEVKYIANIIIIKCRSELFVISLTTRTTKNKYAFLPMHAVTIIFLVRIINYMSSMTHAAVHYMYIISGGKMLRLFRYTRLMQAFGGASSFSIMKAEFRETLPKVLSQPHLP